MKKLLNLKGAKVLSKKELKEVKGGLACAWPDNHCPGTSYCDLATGLCRR